MSETGHTTPTVLDREVVKEALLEILNEVPAFRAAIAGSSSGAREDADGSGASTSATPTVAEMEELHGSTSGKSAAVAKGGVNERPHKWQTVKITTKKKKKGRRGGG